MMFVRLLLLACACALSAAEVPPYIDILENITKAYKILEDNVLSMDGNVPFLNDPRRHYAEIVYVLHSEAWSENSCLGHDYYEDYQRNINKTGPFAIANPQEVVEETSRVIQDVADGILKVVDLINVKTQAMAATDSQTIDEAIDGDINSNIKKYGGPKEVLLALGEVLKQIINNHDRYNFVSQNLNAHSFIINGVEVIKDHVMAWANLYRVLYSHDEISC